MIINLFAILDKAKPDTENVRGFNLATATCTAVQCELLVTGNTLLY
jgi:hypothetical protein